MNPWKLEVESRKAAEWMLRQWMDKFDGANGKPFGWTPWVLTAQNKDTQPVYSHGEAEQIFKRLKMAGIFHEKQFLIQGDNRTASANILPTFRDQIEVSRFIAKTDCFTMKIKPLFEYVLNHPWAIGAWACLIFCASSFFGSYLSKWAERLIELRLPLPN